MVFGADVQRRSPLSASDGEIMTSKRGFFGNPIYRLVFILERLYIHKLLFVDHMDLVLGDGVQLDMG